MTLSANTGSTRDSWNAFVSNQPDGSLYQSYEWGEIRRAQGWEPHYISIVEGPAKVAGALVLIKSLPGGLGSLMYSPRGPVVGMSPHALPALLAAVRDLATSVRGILWRVEPPFREDDARANLHFEEAGFQRIPQEWSFWNRPKYTMELSLLPGESKLFDSLGRKNRWKVRSALNQVQLSSGTSDKDIEAFYRLLEHTAEKKHLLMRGIDYYYKCLEVLSPSMIRVFVAAQGDRPVAAGISTRFGSTASLMHMSNDYTVPNMGWAVQWEMIRWALAEGCKIYDFAGAGSSATYPPKETDEGYGVYRFKQSFGAEIVAWYGYADYVFGPARYELFRMAERSLPYGKRLILDWPKSVWQKLGGSRAARQREKSSVS